MTLSIAEKLKSLGYTLPETSGPAANYVASVKTGNLLYISGQISQDRGEPAFLGRLGAEISLDQGKQAAASAALSLLAQIAKAGNGQIGSVRRLVRLGVFIASTPEFSQHSEVGNGASDLMVKVFGDAGKHARTSIGVAALPAGVAVEIDAIIEMAE